MFAKLLVLSSASKINTIVKFVNTRAGLYGAVRKQCQPGGFCVGVRHAGTQGINPWTEPIPGIELREMINRRHSFIESIKYGRSEARQFHNHLVVLPGTAQGNVSLTYLTGITDRNLCLVMIQRAGSELQTILFLENNAKNVQLMSGTATPSQIQSSLQIDQIYSMDEMEPFLQGLMKDNQYKIWYEESNATAELNRIMANIKGISTVTGVESPAGHVQDMRLLKSPAEVAIIRRTCDITSNAINKAIAASKPGVETCKIRNLIQQEINGNMVDRAMVNLNENRPHQYLKSIEDTILVDAGCELQGYSAGISRTWPVGGNFLPAHRILYNGIYKMQQSLIRSLAEPSGATIGVLMKQAYKELANDLRRASFMKGASVSDIIKVLPKLFKHPLIQISSMDANTTRLTRNTSLAPGMVLSIKPGLHIPEERADISSLYRGKSVQLQDNVLIKEDGVEILSGNCVESPNEIMRTIRDAQDLPPTYTESEKYKV